MRTRWCTARRPQSSLSTWFRLPLPHTSSCLGGVVMGSVTDPVTVIITRAVRPGNEQEFEEAVKAWIPNALAFTGYLGVHMLRPPPGSREYGAVLKFRTQLDWDAFRRAPQYLQFLARIRPHLEDEPRVETVYGLESWLTPLGAHAT